MDYDHILSAHPKRRDRTLYGLNKIAFYINAFVSQEDSYFITCNNFEDLTEKVYKGLVFLNILEAFIFENNSLLNFDSATTEDVIDIDDLDYEWQLSEASNKLHNFVKAFEPYKIGLTDSVLTEVCPEANIELFNCINSTTVINTDSFYSDCLGKECKNYELNKIL